MKLTDKIENFIKTAVDKNKFVFLTSDIDRQLRLFLKKEKFLKSPIKWIYILSQDNISEKELWKKFFLEIIWLLDWVISWDIVLYKWNIPEALEDWKIKELFIYGKNNYTKRVWNVKLNFRVSKVERLTQKIFLNKNELVIEDDVSYIVNNSKQIEKLNNNDKKDLIDTIAKNIILENLQLLVKWWFKIAWITYLAKLFKNYWHESYYKFIQKELKKNNKSINYSKKVKVISNDKKDLKQNINSLLSKVWQKN